MSRTFALTALALMLATPALADEGCSTAPAAQFKPKATLEAQLKSEGLEVRQIKVEDGCYEVYAVKKDGTKVEQVVNPLTGEIVSREDDEG